jgi:hypothetical protein
MCHQRGKLARKTRHTDWFVVAPEEDAKACYTPMGCNTVVACISLGNYGFMRSFEGM